MLALTLISVVVAVVSVGVAVHIAGRERSGREPAGSSHRAPASTVADPVGDAAAPDEDATSAQLGASGADQLMLERFRSVVEHLELGVVMWDGVGDELYRNPVARTMFEARDGQVLVAAAVEDLLAEALAGHTARREVELFGPPAASFVVIAGPFGPGLDGAMALVEDRSLERRTETVRRDFVANISHELKTPIGALGLLAETVRDEPDPDVVARLAERMVLEADRVGRTVDDLLELSGIEFDAPDFGDLDVASVVGEALSRLGPAPEQAGVLLRSEVPPDLVLHGDRRQLVSAVYNLLDNAVKYSSDGDDVVVEAVDDAAEGVVRITVSDSGIGVPRRDIDRIFERFYRVDRARSRRTGGTGLGLAIVRHVAGNHGGEVLVDSTEGVGTTFTLVLPRPSGAAT